MNPYQANKAVLFPERLLALKRGEQPAPAHVLLVLSDLCNQDCSFCLYRIEGYTDKFSIIQDGVKNRNPNRMIPTPKAEEIIADCAAMGVRAIQFTGGGEPTVHPQCNELMTYAQSLGMETAIVTNGIRLDKIMDSVLASAWIRISLDAGRKETYCKVRRVPDEHWNRMLSNIQKLVHHREAQANSLVIGIGFIVTRENYREVIEATQIAKDLGVDNIRLAAVGQPEDAVYFKDFNAEATSLCKLAETFATEKFEVINLFDTRVDDFRLGHPEYRNCSSQHLITYIGADLNVYHCCITAYSEHGTVGSLADQSFRELWESQAKRDRYQQFDARQCPRCQFNEKNREINRLIESMPVLHGNFV